MSRGRRQFTFGQGSHTEGEAFRRAHICARSLSLSHAQNARTPACSLSVSQTSAGPIQQQCELPDSLLSISRHAAEKEEFHFWSLRRVRTYILLDFQSSLSLSRRNAACLGARLIAVSPFDDCADSLSAFFSPSLPACLTDCCGNVIT